MGIAGKFESENWTLETVPSRDSSLTLFENSFEHVFQLQKFPRHRICFNKKIFFLLFFFWIRFKECATRLRRFSLRNSKKMKSKKKKKKWGKVDTQKWWLAEWLRGREERKGKERGRIDGRISIRMTEISRKVILIKVTGREGGIQNDNGSSLLKFNTRNLDWKTN